MMIGEFTSESRMSQSSHYPLVVESWSNNYPFQSFLVRLFPYVEKNSIFNVGYEHTRAVWPDFLFENKVNSVMCLFNLKHC